jgi:hypothetical protein
MQESSSRPNAVAVRLFWVPTMLCDAPAPLLALVRSANHTAALPILLLLWLLFLLLLLLLLCLHPLPNTSMCMAHHTGPALPLTFMA